MSLINSTLEEKEIKIKILGEWKIEKEIPNHGFYHYLCSTVIDNITYTKIFNEEEISIILEDDKS